MNRRSLHALMVSVTLAASGSSLAADPIGPDKVVYHINDEITRLQQREGYAYLRP